MGRDEFLRNIAAATLDLSPEELDGLANCIGRELACVMRVRRDKLEAAQRMPRMVEPATWLERETLPPPETDERAVVVGRLEMATISERGE
jgi:hypothetical protein